MGSSTRHILLLLITVVVSGCDPTKRIPQGTHLLKRNVVITTERRVDVEELQAIIKQKPNKRILGLPLYLGLYNLRDPIAVQDKRALKDSLCMERNVKRAAKGKHERRCDRSTRERNGEAPVVLDSVLTRRSADQIRLYMHKEGWFKATVSDSAHYRHRRLIGKGRGEPYRQPKAEVEYTVVTGPMYRLRRVRFTVDDARIRGYVASIWNECLLDSGDRYDDDALDAERVRITNHLNELGYLYFTKDLIFFNADTTVGDHQVDLMMRMERPLPKGQRGLTGTPEGTVYTVEDVFIRTTRGTTPDTTRSADYVILHTGKLQYRPKALLGSIFLVPNSRYRMSDGTDTYARLTGLRVFDRVEITYDTVGTSGPGMANAHIGLLLGKPQSTSTEVYGTNRGGFLGTTLSLGYRHRNLMRTLGFIQAQFNVAFETQQIFTRGATTEQAIGDNTLFNTISIGPELTIGLPRPFRKFSKSSASRMTLNLLYNFQRRPDFTRTLARGSFGFEWNSAPTQHWDFRLPELSIIKIPSRSGEFNDFLLASNDPVFINSYTDHLILSFPKVVYTWNTQGVLGQRNVKFLRITGESAGSALRALSSGLNAQTDTITERTYESLFGIRYAEFLKFDGDLRLNRAIHDRSSLAFRLAAGIGVPLTNLEVLPFETAFFGGGANGLRAWQARSLGPGSYNAPLLTFDRVGEVRLEANLEYRFKLIGYLEGALFTDVGNIWNRRKDPRRPGAEFEVIDFMDELAVGTGVGARLNFDFFIVRFDLGMQTKDPSLPRGERWLFQPKDQYEAEQAALGTPLDYRTRFNLNLGIGYPF